MSSFTMPGKPGLCCVVVDAGGDGLEGGAELGRGLGLVGCGERDE